MTKKLLIISAAVIMILSLTACSTYRKADKQQVKPGSSQTVKQEGSQGININNKAKNNPPQNAGKANPAKGSQGVNGSNAGSGGTAAIDELTKTIKDMGGTIDSLDDVSDEDLNVPSPQ